MDAQPEWSLPQRYEHGEDLVVHQFPCLDDNYGYIIQHKSFAIGVDLPAGCGKLYAEWCKKLELGPITHMLITHWHWDHLGGVPELQADNFKLNDGVKFEMYGSEVEMPSMAKYCAEGDFTRLLNGGDVVTIGDLSFSVDFLPGHTHGHIGFGLLERNLVFVGDCLFAMGCGRLFEGTGDQMHASLHHIAGKYRDDCMVYCAHEYTSVSAQYAEHCEPENRFIQERIEEVIAKRARRLPTVPFSIGIEKKTNPYLLARRVEVFKERRTLRNKWQAVAGQYEGSRL